MLIWERVINSPILGAQFHSLRSWCLQSWVKKSSISLCDKVSDHHLSGNWWRPGEKRVRTACSMLICQIPCGEKQSIEMTCFKSLGYLDLGVLPSLWYGWRMSKCSWRALWNAWSLHGFCITSSTIFGAPRGPLIGVRFPVHVLGLEDSWGQSPIASNTPIDGSNKHINWNEEVEYG